MFAVITNIKPVVHLGDNDFNIVEITAVAKVKPLDESQRRQFRQYPG